MTRVARRWVLATAGAWASGALAPARAAPPKEIAVTFDDLPVVYGDLRLMQRVTRDLLGVLQKERVPTVGFVNEDKLQRAGELAARTALLQAWVDAGMELGNHTYSHLPANRTALTAYQEDVMRGENVTRRLLAGRGRLRWFRHPYLQRGPTPEYAQALDSFLAGRGYGVAPITISAKDYMFAAVYRDASAARDETAKSQAAAAYLQHMAACFDHAEQSARTLFGRPMRHVLLVHVNELNADHFGAAVRLMRDRGYRFVSLERALADPAYRSREAHTPAGASWLNRWAMAKGVRLPPDPPAPAAIAEAYARRTAAVAR